MCRSSWILPPGSKGTDDLKKVADPGKTGTGNLSKGDVNVLCLLTLV